MRKDWEESPRQGTVGGYFKQIFEKGFKGLQGKQERLLGNMKFSETIEGDML